MLKIFQHYFWMSKMSRKCPDLLFIMKEKQLLENIWKKYDFNLKFSKNGKTSNFLSKANF